MLPSSLASLLLLAHGLAPDMPPQQADCAHREARPNPPVTKEQHVTRLNNNIITEFDNTMLPNGSDPWHLHLDRLSLFESSRSKPMEINFNKGSLTVSNSSTFKADSIANSSVRLNDNATVELSGKIKTISNCKIYFQSDTARLILTHRSVSEVVAGEFAGGQFFLTDNKPAVIGKNPSVLEPGDNLLIVSQGQGCIISRTLPKGTAATPATPKSQPNTKSNDATPGTTIALWTEQGGAVWSGGDKSNPGNLFSPGNWTTTDISKNTTGGYNLKISGNSFDAKANADLALPSSSALMVTDGATINFATHGITYSGTAAIVIDSAYLNALGKLHKINPEDKATKLDIILTKNSILDSTENHSQDFGGGSLLVTDSTCGLNSIKNCTVRIAGYGSIEVSSADKDLLSGTTIDLTSTRAQFRFVHKPIDQVIQQDLDKFSARGKLPVYGEKPDFQEPGDNILIRKDGANGTILSVIE